MKTNRHFYIGIAFLVMLTFACTLFSAPVAPQPSFPEEPPTAAPPQAEEVPQAPVTEPEIISQYLPIGVATSTGSGLRVFDRLGYTLVEINTPGLFYSDRSNLHLAGGLPEGSANLPVVYFSFEQNESLLLNTNGQISTLLPIPYFAGLAGATGEPVVAYTTADLSTSGSLLGQLYVGRLESLPTAAPVLTDDDPQGWALVALAVDVENDEPVGVWYSKRPWGIGGDIVFDPRRTLSYLDLGTRTVSQFLGAEANPSAISADRIWLAYTDDTSVGAGAGEMMIRNILSGVNISFPLLPAVDPRGAGNAVFSPGNQYIAWMEGNGFQMAETPNFHSVVRVGNMNGNTIAEFADTALVTVSGLGIVQRVEPVGWFDDETLVIMARGERWDETVLLKIDIPSKTPSFLAQGAFVGFVYP